MHQYQITVYSGPACQRCKFIKRYLTGKGIPFTEKQAAEKTHHDYLKALGYQEIPVTTVHRDGVLWVQFGGANMDVLDDVIDTIKREEREARDAA